MTICVLTLLLLGQCGDRVDKPGIQIEASLDRDNPGLLKVQMTCNLESPIEIATDDLPWKNRYSLATVAVEADRYYPPLRQLYQVDDPGLATTVLMPGMVLSGKVDLLERFPDLQKVLERCEVILFWTYKLGAAGGHHFMRSSGSIVIPCSTEGGARSESSRSHPD